MAESGITDLHYAVMKRDTNRVKELIRDGADVNKVTTGDELSPLHIAALVGDSDIIRMLLVEGANVNAVVSPGLDLVVMLTKCIDESMDEEKEYFRKILSSYFKA